MNANAAITVGLVVAFGALVCAHVANVFGLLVRRRFGAAMGGLLFPPLAPIAAFLEGMRFRAITWASLAVAYGVLFVLAL